MKTVASQYREAVEQAKRTKPRSKRRIVLVNRAANLLLRQLKIENRTRA
jgi:hypothetical protein